MKYWLFTLTYKTGFVRLVQFLNNMLGKRLTILTLHRVGMKNENDYSGLPNIFIKVENFKKIVGFIKKYYNVISLKQFYQYKNEGKKLPNNSLMITFDDGYKDAYEYAFPLLKEHNFPFVLFLPSDLLNGKVDYWWDRFYNYGRILDNNTLKKVLIAKELPTEIYSAVTNLLDSYPDHHPDMIENLIIEIRKLPKSQIDLILADIKKKISKDRLDRITKNELINSDEVNEMLQNGAELGSHTVTHCFLDSISFEEGDIEINESKKVLEGAFYNKIDSFAYPGGLWRKETEESLLKSGYLSAFTCESGINDLSQNPLFLKRINVTDDMFCLPNDQYSEALTANRLILPELFNFIRQLKSKIF